MKIKINGKECSCEKGEYILDIARRNGIFIPTLCNHASIEEGQGCCRLCIVEITERGRKSVVVSCVYPVNSEIEVETDNAKIRRERGMILALLRSRAPESQEIAMLCKMYGAPDIERFVENKNEKCIMCGLCVKACQSMALSAISTVNRGITKMVSTPYGKPSEACIGCGACAYICPTGAIEVSENSETRTIWGKEFTLIHCKKCGAVIGTKEQLTKASELNGLDPVVLCDECRKKELAEVFAHTV